MLRLLQPVTMRLRPVLRQLQPVLRLIETVLRLMRHELIEIQLQLPRLPRMNVLQLLIHVL